MPNLVDMAAAVAAELGIKAKAVPKVISEACDLLGVGDDEDGLLAKAKACYQVVFGGNAGTVTTKKAGLAAAAAAAPTVVSPFRPACGRAVSAAELTLRLWQVLMRMSGTEGSQKGTKRKAKG